MVARGPGAVGCAHCRKLGAETACGVCKHLVCAACAGDWSTCDQPCSRMFQLPRGDRLVDVDPSGRVGLVRGDLTRHLELRTPRWLDTRGSLPEHAPELADGVVGVRGQSIVVHRMTGGVLEQVCQVATTGAVAWVELAFPYLAALVRGGAEDGLLLWRIGNNPAMPSMRLHLAERVRVAALSRDGRYLAAAFDDHRVFVRDIEDGGSITFDEHTAPVALVRFAGTDRLLVTADDKGRVVLRTHAAGGYLRELVRVPIRES